jgi:hypothetical protein
MLVAPMVAVVVLVSGEVAPVVVLRLVAYPCARRLSSSAGAENPALRRIQL